MNQSEQPAPGTLIATHWADSPTRQDELLRRAILLIRNNWGYSEERAQKWLEDDDYDWNGIIEQIEALKQH